jgi:hypothetical protein
MKTIIALLCLLMIPVLPVEGAEIIQEKNTIMGCHFRIEGEINRGDGERIETFIQNFDNDVFYTGEGARLSNKYGSSHFKRICLNSPGGSLSEAIIIAKAIYGEWGTAVSANNTCESACSLIFMAGSFAPEDDRGIIANRILHPLGRLGFHAPKLTIEEGNYSAGTVSKAYNIALQGIWQIYDISGFIKFPPSLIGEMIATPPDEMLYVETIGQTARWQIMIAPTIHPRKLTKLAVINACNNHYLYVSEIISLNGFYSRSHKTQYDTSELKIKKSDYGKVAFMGGFGQEAASECKLNFYDTTDDHRQIPTKSIGWVSIGENIGTEINSGHFFGPSTKITSLARQNDLTLENIDVYTRSEDIRISTGRCYVFSAGLIIDNDPCTQVKEIRYRKDAKALSSFVWPSGAKTILESKLPESYDYKINGIKTETEIIQSWSRKHRYHPIFKKRAEQDKIADWETLCWLNPSTLNRFCFQKYFSQPRKFR